MMRRCVAAMLACACLGLHAWAETPKAVIQAPKGVPSGAQVLAVIAGASVSDQPLAWTMEGPSGAFMQVGTFEGAPARSVALIYSPPDGSYRFKVVAIGTPAGGAITADADVATVTVGGQLPPMPPPIPPPTPPAPTPIPDPPPAPVPVVVGPIHVSLVTDLDSPEPDTTTIRIAREIRPALDGLAASYRTYGITSPDLNRLNLLALAVAAKGPALIVQDDKGKVLFSGPSPLDEAGVIAKVKSIREGR